MVQKYQKLSSFRLRVQLARAKRLGLSEGPTECQGLLHSDLDTSLEVDRRVKSLDTSHGSFQSLFMSNATRLPQNSQSNVATGGRLDEWRILLPGEMGDVGDFGDMGGARALGLEIRQKSWRNDENCLPKMHHANQQKLRSR